MKPAKPVHHPYKLGKAKFAIEQWCTIEKAIKIHDIAEAARHYAKVRDLGLEAINNAAELKIWAERKTGEFSRGLPVTYSRHDGEQTKTQPLKKAGVNPHHANRFEAIADIPQQVKGCPGRETEKGVKKPASLEDLGAKLILHKIFDSTLSFVSINLAWPNIKLRWSVYQRRVCLRLFGL